MSSNAVRFEDLQKRLNGMGIPTDKAGFFDHPAFVAMEREDPSFLDEYARLVHWRTLDPAYLERAERIINVVADKLHRGLMTEGRLGACIDTSMTMGRILDLFGVWNYVVRGSLRITFPADSGHEPFFFWPVDEDDGSGREFGHKWLVAPPFSVIDVTVKLQEYPRPFRDLLPETVLAKNPPTTTVEPEDILCPKAILLARQQGASPAQALALFVPKFVRFFAADFPAYMVHCENGVRLKYVPIGIGGSDAPLSHIRSFVVQGRTAFEYYEQEIKPALAGAGFEETLSESDFPGASAFGPKRVTQPDPTASPSRRRQLPTAGERAGSPKKRKRR